MSKKLHISVSDWVFYDLESLQTGNNRSEFVEEILRLGIIEYKKKQEVESNESS